jgi:hypothetical protein
MTASVAVATLVRQGPRLVLLDAVFLQGEERVARASALFLQPSTAPEGEVWSATTDGPFPPPVELAPEGSEHHVPFFASAKPWSNNFREHQNSGRHQTWQTAMPIVAGEPMTPFQAAASIADNTSMISHWSNKGVEYINADISLALARRPAGVELGLRALDHVAVDGVSIGTVEVFDRLGVLGVATVTALANTRRTADFSQSEYDGTARSPVA